jgi:hypothetical protein
MRLSLIQIVVGAALVALVLVGVPPAAAPPSSGASSCTGPGAPLFGVARAGAHQRVLGRIARRTLELRSRGRVKLPEGVYGWGFAFSPDCETVALPASSRGHILLVDLKRGRQVGRVSAGGGAAAATIAWPEPGRLVALTGAYRSPRLVTLSMPGGRRIASHRLGGPVASAEPTSLGVVALAAPLDRIGPSTLVLARPDGTILRVPLERIRSGTQVPRRDPRRGRQLVPGLAVDEDSGRAYVIAASSPLVAEVDLHSGAAAYHDLDGSRTATAAKGLAYAAYRTARWMGNGTIAVSGDETRTALDWRRVVRRGELPTRVYPYGLRLVDTADWSMRTLHPLLRGFFATGDTLVGMDTIPVSPRHAKTTGLVAYGLDGGRLSRRFQDRPLARLAWASWPYAYVSMRGRRVTHAIDLRTGRSAGHLADKRPPVLLVR